MHAQIHVNTNAFLRSFTHAYTHAYIHDASMHSSTLKTKEDAMIYQCKVCRQTFMCTATVELLQQHVDNKHKGKGYKDCFDYTYVAAPHLATVWEGAHRAHAALGTEAKKGFPKDLDIEEFATKEEAYEYIKQKVEYLDDDGISFIDTDHVDSS